MKQSYNSPNMQFSSYWKMLMHGEGLFEKASLSKSEIIEVQGVIQRLQKKGLPSSKIIDALQKQNAKLSERWKAERAYWTEVKSNDTKVVGEIGEDLDVSKYGVILSPNACEECRKKSDRGKKIFKNADIEKSGYGHVPPFHPNCFCILIPKA